MTAHNVDRSIHRPQVAGLFYPYDPDECAKLVRDCVDGGKHAVIGAPKVLIAPHAGYIYSGPIAGTAYRALGEHAANISRVVLVGPAHRYPLKGLATTSASGWATSLGVIPVDQNGVAALLKREDFRIFDHAFNGEHSLEVQLPFLQKVLPPFSLLPILAGEISAHSMADALETVWGGPETLIVISSDLNHFHDYETARKLDRATGEKIETLDHDLTGENACGCRGIAGAIVQARRRDLRVTALDIRNSGDTAGDKARVVGYGAFAMEYAETARLHDADRHSLLEAVSRALAISVKSGQPAHFSLHGRVPPTLHAKRATFVTLKIDGDLRGCVGSIVPHQSLLEDVISNAFKAGFADRRFTPLSDRELPRLSIEISILSYPRPIRFENEDDLLKTLRPGKDGLIIEDGPNRALFLPAVWKSLPEPSDFLAHLKRKAGFPDDYWSSSIRARRFTTETFGSAWMSPREEH